MRIALLLVLILLLAPGLAARTGTSLDHARQARRLLGADGWSQIIELRNDAARSVYPKKLAALVFEFGGLLWFYTDTDGTQSLSLHTGRLAEEKAELGPLLAAIEPGFRRFRIVPPDDDAVTGPAKPLPNGCFVESVAALRAALARGELIEEARLLSYYVRGPGGARGHTVLVYRTPRGAFVIDAAEDGRPSPLPAGLPGPAIAVARALRPDLAGVTARWVPTSVPADTRLAGAAHRDLPTGARLR